MGTCWVALGLRIQGLGVRVAGLGFRACVLVLGFGFAVGSGKVQVWAFWVPGL